ncbi:MAG: aryl-sulfate sulfotransferase [Myxococcales bacterium]|nr:aryl-sulfate sulfotransferase [Myxococcales bacterium]
MSIDPPVATAGAEITIAGNGFGATQGSSRLLYDGEAIAVVSWSATRIVATLPDPKPTGFYDVVVETDGGASNPFEHRICPAGGCPFEVHHLNYIVNGDNGLSGFLEFSTDVPTTPEVTVIGPERTFVVPTTGWISQEPNKDHRIGVLGLRQGTTYAFEVTATDGDENVTPVASTQHRTLTLDPLDFPMHVLVSDPSRMSPGYTFFFSPRGPDYQLMYAIDAEGELVWYHRVGNAPLEIHRLANGNLFWGGQNYAEEIDMYGASQRYFDIADIGPTGIDSMHHDFQILPNGNYLTLSTEAREISGYPGGETHTVVGDVIVEFDQDLDIVQEWKLLDLLDPYRTPPGFNNPFWAALYGPESKDWTHTNSVVYDATDDTMVLSVRHQDIVIKMTRDDPPSLAWVIGEDFPGSAGDDAWPFLELVGPGAYPNHQHAAEVLPNGHILLYDNGESTGVTRAVEYALDPVGMTMTQAWAWIDPDYSPPLFAPFVGDVDLLPNGNVLYFDGALVDLPVPVLNPISLRVCEFNPYTSEKLFEGWMYADNVTYRGYRAVRFPTLYPPEP